MSKLKSLFLSSALSLALIIPGFASSLRTDDLTTLEQRFPAHFAGFSAAPLGFADEIRKSMKNPFIVQPGLEPLFGRLLMTLDGKPEFVDLHGELKAYMNSSPEHTLIRYVYFIFKLAGAQKTGLPEEGYFLKGAGFPHPYSMINRPDFTSMLSDFNQFLAGFATSDDDEDDDDDDSRIGTTHHFRDKKDAVRNQFVYKGPFSSVVLPLPGEDNLGYFYLALTYLKGIHPLAIPIEDNRCELHGISMSRYAKFCHDMAHFQDDPIDQIVHQFICYLIDHNLNIARTALNTLTAEQRKRHAVRYVLPHCARFGMDVHNLYHKSLLDILWLSLKDLNPLEEAKRVEFEAFSVASCLVVHEQKNFNPKAYGTPILKDILTSEIGLKDDDGVTLKDDDTVKVATVVKAKDLLKTSYRTGETALTDSEIFDLVKVRPLFEFQGRYSYSDSNRVNIELNEVLDYVVLRNKLYIDVKICMFDNTEHKFREQTNYSIRLNLKHDLIMLESAAHVLKRDYNYELPAVPVIESFQDDSAYEKAARECRKALDEGFKHLKEIWLKQCIRLSELKTAEESPSIAEKFASEYATALDQASQNCFPDMPLYTSALLQEGIEFATGRKKLDAPANKSVSEAKPEANGEDNINNDNNASQ